MIHSTDNNTYMRHWGQCPMLRAELAAEAVKQFINGKRETGGQHQRPVTIKLSAPQWAILAVSRAHADLVVNDWRYKVARQAFEAIADADPHTSMQEIAEGFQRDTTSRASSATARCGAASGLHSDQQHPRRAPAQPRCPPRRRTQTSRDARTADRPP